jgi:hypothetical protein
MRFLAQSASRAFINNEVRIPPTDAPNVAADNRIAFMPVEGSRGGFVDLSNGIGSGSSWKGRKKDRFVISFTDISAYSRMRPLSYKSCDDCAKRQWPELRLFVMKTRHRRRGDFDGQKLVCLCEIIDRRCRGFDRQNHDCLWKILDRHCGDFDGQKPACLWESLDRRCGDFDR